MARSRKEKNKKVYDELEKELKNNKGDNYEEKLKTIDPNLNAQGDNFIKESSFDVGKKSEHKSGSALTVIAKKVKSEKKETKKDELVVVKKEKKAFKKKERAEVVEQEYNEPVSYTDKLSVEAILRAKIEQQQKIKEDKRNLKKSPNTANYTPSMMQERIKPHVGVDVRREVNIKTKNYTWLAITILINILVVVVIVGLLLIFKVI